MDKDDLFHKAVEAHIRGDLERALALYGEVIEGNPDHAEALHNAGVIYLTRGDTGKAIHSFREALRIRPDYPDALNNLATALKRTGDREAALRSMERAVSLRPGFVEAHFNLGNLYREMGQYERAAESFQTAACLNPHDHEALNNLGAVLSSLGQYEEARKACVQSLHVRPHQASAHYNLGTISMREGKKGDAVQSFLASLRIDPRFSDAHLNLGTLLAMEGKMDEATECFRKALSCNPRSPDAYYNLGLAFERKGDLDGEISTQRAALDNCPEDVRTWIGAVRAFSKVAEWGEVDRMIQKILGHDFTESEASLLSSTLFHLHSYPMADEDLFRKHVLWGTHALKGAERLLTGVPLALAPHARERDRLRIGYVSPDFCRHSVGWFFREIALHHDAERFEVLCYAAGPGEDDLTREIQAAVAGFHRVVGWDTLSLARKVSEDGVQILVDLGGHTLGNRLDLFALKPAAIQVTMIGYPNGTGLKTIAYRITEERAETQLSRACCLEKHVYLPGGFLPFYPVRISGEAPSRGELGLPENGVLMVSFNRAGKLRPEVLRLWDRLLTRCQGAFLALCCGPVNRGDLRRNVLSFFSSPENRKRVFFIGRAETEERHRARYLAADLALDPFPYAGTTTSYEAIAMGVPVMTLVGERHVQRTTYSLLSQLGISETVASDESEYVDKAAALVLHPDMLRAVKERLARSYLERVKTHSEEYVRSLERAFVIMWERYLRGEPAREISLREKNGVTEEWSDGVME